MRLRGRGVGRLQLLVAAVLAELGGVERQLTAAGGGQHTLQQVKSAHKLLTLHAGIDHQQHACKAVRLVIGL